MSPKKHRPMTIKHARMKSNDQPTDSRLASQGDRIMERQIDRDERASKIREKHKRRRETARKRKDREQKDRERHKASNTSEPTQLAGHSHSQMKSTRAMGTSVGECKNMNKAPKTGPSTESTGADFREEDVILIDDSDATAQNDAEAGSQPPRSGIPSQGVPNASFDSGYFMTYAQLAESRSTVQRASFEDLASDIPEEFWATGTQLQREIDGEVDMEPAHNPRKTNAITAQEQLRQQELEEELGMQLEDIPDEFWVSDTQLQRDVYGDVEAEQDNIPENFWVTDSQLQRELLGVSGTQPGPHPNEESFGQYESSIPVEYYVEAEARLDINVHRSQNDG